MTDANKPPPLPTLQPGDSHMESLIDAAIQGHASTREAMRWLVRQLVPATQPAEVTDDLVEKATVETFQKTGADLIPEVAATFARAILALRPVQMNALAGCNCRWDGDNQVEWCELHLAHKEAIHEWAERAKSAEQKLALRPVQVPMTDEDMMSCLASATGDIPARVPQGWRNVMRAVEAHHGITAQAKKGGV